ncbi:MAG: Rid family hydrolase [bacterium]
MSMDQYVRDKMLGEEACQVGRFVFAGSRHYESYGETSLHAEGSLMLHKGDAGKSDDEVSMQVMAVSGTPIIPIRQKGRNIGVIFEDENARYCRLSGLMPLDISASRETQARAVLEMADFILSTNGFQFTDTVRTWFYLDRLLEWYAGFNEVRTAFFKARAVFEKMVPASTGIGASNPWGAALIGDLLAIQPKSPSVHVRAVPSPLQDSALNYASSFSRAVEIKCPTYSSLLISGTASIDRVGNTVFKDDHAGQIEQTLQVVEALLRSRSMTWGDVVRGIAYFTDMTDHPIFDAACRRHGLPAFPLARARADICRHDLIFELEVDAISTPGCHHAALDLPAPAQCHS